MSILTKVSVVVLLVLILLACPVFITQATVAPNYRIAYEQQVEKTQLYELAAKQAQLATARATSLYNNLLEKSRTQIDERQAQINALQAQLNQEKADKAAQATRIDQLNVTVTNLQKNLEAALAQNTLLDEQLNGNPDKGIKGARQAIQQLQDEQRKTEGVLKAAQAEAERLQRVVMVKDEDVANLNSQVFDLNAKLEDLRRKAVVVASTDGGTTPLVDVKAPTEVTGTVTAVREPDMASINIGSAKGVVPGQTLIIYRGASFVAHLKVAEVDINGSAGVITDRKLDPMQGDKVTSSLK